MKTHRYRTEILEACTGCHRTAEEIFEAVRTLRGDVGFSTVYRNVEELVRDGSLKKISGLDRKARFERNVDGHVAHFVDESSGEVFDLAIPESALFALLPPGFSPSRADLRIFGRKTGT